MNWTKALSRAFSSRQGRGRRAAFARFLPRLEELESRLVPYAVSGDAWPNPQLITLSFVPDGTLVGIKDGHPVASNLQATLNARFGSTANWENIFLKAAQNWAQQTNLNFTVVADNGAPYGSGPDQQGDPNMGDIRIGGYNFGNNNLAVTYMPPSDNNFSLAGDMVFNTGKSFNNGATFDLYTVATHEIGHSLGLDHSGIISATMYYSYEGVKNSLNNDDINGIRAIYSGGNPRSYDSNGGTNNIFATATNITPAIDPTSDTAVLTGLDNTTTTDAEYYMIGGNAPTSSSTATITVQSKGLSLLAPKITVYAADQHTVLATASGSGYQGSTVSVTLTNQIGQGQPVYIKVTGANTTAFGTGAYALTVNTGTGANPTVPLPNTTVADGSTIQGGGGSAVEISDEALVNSTTAGSQQLGWGGRRAVASDANGNSVIVWQSQNEDGSGWGIFGQLYDAQSNRVGPEFQINSTTWGDQCNPSVAMAANGNFVVTWQSQNQDGSGWGIYGQMFDAQGNAIGSEFQVNTTTAGDQCNPAIAMDQSGNYLITWQGQVSSNSGLLGNLFHSSSNAIFGQRYDAQGNALGGEFQVNTTLGNDSNPSAAMNANGDTVVVWQSQNQDGSGWGIFGQRYDASGNAVGGEFRINTTKSGDQSNPSVSLDANGNFVVVWQSQNQDGSGWGIFGQRYDASGNASGGEFQVNTVSSGDQINPVVSMNGEGQFVVAWQSQNEDGSGWGIYARQYGMAGSPLGPEFLANTTTKGDQQFSAVNLDSLGNLIIAWSGQGSGDKSGVFFKHYVTDTNAEDAGAWDAFDPNEQPPGSKPTDPGTAAQTAATSITALAPTSGSLVALTTPAPVLSPDAGLSFWVAGTTLTSNITASPTAAPVASTNVNHSEPAFVSGALGLDETASPTEMTYTLASSPTNPASDEAVSESEDDASDAENLTDSCFIDPAWMSIRDESPADSSAAADGGDE